ncbi:MAG TPA: DUF4139 domain-containing protein [Bacteroidota bacterium]|nr:DUF4139 domain-containing protein [Bacteroidota bacterium]
MIRTLARTLFMALVLIPGGAGWHATGTAFAQKNIATAGDRTSVDLTVYNQNLSLVREERSVLLTGGLNTVVVPDIPATIDGTSLHFRSLMDPTGVRILEQNYQYDLVSQAKLLEKYLGKEIEFVRLNEETKQEYTVRGKLLATGFGGRAGVVAEINGKIEMDPAGRMVLPSLPEGLILRPRLRWMVDNSTPGKHNIELSYLAGGLSWSSDYVALLSEKDDKLDLTGWVTLVNNSGAAFQNAGLKLVAGDVNVVSGAIGYDMRAMKSLNAAEAAAPQFQQSELFEYKLYTLQRKTDLNPNETKQIELVSGRDVASKKMFIYDGVADQWRYWWNNPSYRNQQSFGQQSNTKVGTYVTFMNEKKSGLGIPLPKGKVRVYKLDTDGKEQFVGEDRIDHTPKDEEIRLYLGNAFDIVGERAQTDFKSFASGKVVEETIRIKVRNHKDEKVTVQVYEHPWRWNQWEITKKSTEFEKVDQSTIRFPVTIPADGEVTVTYTIRYSW